MEIIDHNFIIREDCPHMGRDFVLYRDAHPQRKLGKAFSLHNFTLVTIVEAGELDLNINGIFTCCIRGKGLLYHLPEQIFTLEHISDDYAGRYIIMSNDFISHLGLEVQMETSWHLMQQPFLPLNNQAMNAIFNVYEMYAAMLLQTNNPHRFTIVQHLTRAYFLSFDFYYHSHYPDTKSNSRNHELTQQFFNLLRQHVHKEHTVQYYADRLHITPKYLSACIKQATGQNAKQCIDKYLVKYAQHLLTTEMRPAKSDTLPVARTVAQVAYELGFSDPATFSRYFYNQTGIRPRDWRERIR
ncbi:MAG: helix-turn-helix domain-containing protein [Paludibacteraceae bacterium]